MQLVIDSQSCEVVTVRPPPLTYASWDSLYQYQTVVRLVVGLLQFVSCCGHVHSFGSQLKFVFVLFFF